MLLVYWRLFTPTTGGAYVAIWCDDRVLIIRNSYKRGWTLPSGGKKRDETIQATAIREVREEVAISLSPDSVQRVARFSSREEYKDDVVTMFESSFEEEPAFEIDNTEVVEAKFITFEEAIQNLSQFNGIVRQYFQWKHEHQQTDTRPKSDDLLGHDQTSASCNSAATSPID